MSAELQQHDPAPPEATGETAESAFSGSDDEFAAFHAQRQADVAALASQVVEADANGIPPASRAPADDGQPPPIAEQSEPAAAPEGPAPPAEPSDVAELRAELKRSREQNEQLMALLRPQAAAGAPEAPPAHKDPWELTSQEIGRQHARQVLGETVPDYLLDEWSSTVAARDKWAPYANVTAAQVGDDEAKAQELRANAAAETAKANDRLRTIHARAKEAAESAALRAQVRNLEAQVQALTKPETKQAAVLKALTSDVLIASEYPLVAEAVKAGGLDLAAVFDGVDFSKVDMAKPETMAVLDARIAGAERVLAIQRKAQAPPPSAKPTPAPQNPAGLLPPPAQPDQSTGETPQFLADAEYDADLSRHMAERQRVRERVNPGPLAQRRSG